MTKTEAVNAFKAFVKQGEKLSDYYCGITNNISAREDWHKTKFLYYLIADSVESANDLEQALDEAGFYCGNKSGNAHEEDSKFVYIYEITPYTRETDHDDMSTKKYK